MKPTRASPALGACFCAVLGSSVFGQTAIEPVSILEKLTQVVCVPVQQGGSLESLKVQGEVKAGLEGLIGKLADAGLSGAAEFNSSEYIGFLQSELAGQINAYRACNLVVFDSLKDEIARWISAPAAQTPEVARAVNAVTPNVIVNRGNGNLNMQGSGNTGTVNN